MRKEGRERQGQMDGKCVHIWDAICFSNCAVTDIEVKTHSFICNRINRLSERELLTLSPFCSACSRRECCAVLPPRLVHKTYKHGTGGHYVPLLSQQLNVCVNWGAGRTGRNDGPSLKLYCAVSV